MSDIPWAVAWYGDRKCVGLTRYAYDAAKREDLYAINDFRHALAGVYLTQRTTDREFFDTMEHPKIQRELSRSEITREGGQWEASWPVNSIGWPEFVLSTLVEQRMPTGFPLRFGHTGFVVAGHLLVMDRKRWENEDDLPTTGTSAEGSRGAEKSESNNL
jgi:hypothetical protein